jgi:3-oxoacyl-[acyl-carrier-protein] synthase-3
MTRIVAVGHALPDRRVTSAELEQRLGLEAGWIERRTGIRERRYAAPDEATSDLAVAAGRDALTRGRERLSAPVGMLLLATSTPDHLLPPTAPLVAHRLGLTGCGAIDLAGACTGFLAALALGHSYCRTHGCSVLVVAANVLSRRINPADPMTAVLFADGAGAVLLGPDPGPDAVLAVHADSRGDLYDQITIPVGGSRTPLTPEAVRDGSHLMRMARGPELYREAVRGLVRCGTAALERAGLTAADVDWWVPHQANARVVRDAGDRLGIGPERTVSAVETLGNSSAASIPVALARAARDGRFRPGQLLLLTAVGAGMTEAAAVIRWTESAGG